MWQNSYSSSHNIAQWLLGDFSIAQWLHTAAVMRWCNHHLSVPDEAVTTLKTQHWVYIYNLLPYVEIYTDNCNVTVTTWASTRYTITHTPTCSSIQSEDTSLNGVWKSVYKYIKVRTILASTHSKWLQMCMSKHMQNKAKIWLIPLYTHRQSTYHCNMPQSKETDLSFAL